MLDIVFGLIFLALIVAILIFTTSKKEKDKYGYLLDDPNFNRNLAGECVDDRVEKWTAQDGRYLGHALFACPREAQTSMNPTMPPGGTSMMALRMCFQLRKWEYQIQKVDEWIEVSPAHVQYYQMTHKQKEELEGRIKQGLASAAQAVADLELLKHDERKYREFLDYLGLEYKGNGVFEPIEDRKPDEHSLKAVFIDLVDVHTGDGISMRSIVSRWPTLIVDFLKLNENDMDPDAVKNKLDISKAEAVVLITKNKLYQEWKKLFTPEIKARYERIDTLVKSREHSVREYREWLKPLIARHKILEEGLATPGRRKELSTMFIQPVGHAISLTEWVYWTWRYSQPAELQKGGTERQAIEQAGEKQAKVKPDDKWTRKNLIYHPKHGLIVKYPWIEDKWVDEQLEWIMAQKGERTPWIIPHRLYYAFHIIKITKANIRTPTGEEIEDTVFDVNLIYMTQNVLFVKLLELKAKQEELNRYVDNLIGVGPGEAVLEEKKEKEGISKKISKFTNYFGLGMTFIKRGPYERDFIDRITKYHFATASANRYGVIVDFLKKQMGLGEK